MAQSLVRLHATACVAQSHVTASVAQSHVTACVTQGLVTACNSVCGTESGETVRVAQSLVNR